MFTANAALELYATAFEEAGCLDKLAAFACVHGPAFYGLQPNADRLPASSIHLKREEWTVPDSYAFGPAVVVPCKAGETLHWRAYVEEEVGSSASAASGAAATAAGGAAAPATTA